MAENTRMRLILGFAAVYLIWGSTYLAIKIGVRTIPPFMLIGLRFILGGAILHVWMRMRGVKMPTFRQWLSATVIGILLIAGGTGLVAYAELTVPSGLAALLIAVAPMWLVLADWIGPGGKKPKLTVVLGLILGFIGVALLIDPRVIESAVLIDKFGLFVVVLATIFWAVGSIYSRHAPMPQSKLLGSSMYMLAGGLALLVASISCGEMESFSFASVSNDSWFALLYLIILGSLGFVSYIWLLSATTAAKAATYAYVNPVIALVLGYLLADELIDAKVILCSTIIIVSVVIIVSAKKESRNPENKDIVQAKHATL